ncbi:MAG: excinuclease ABC subunit UvrB [Sphingobacteriia bacterium]|nr:excinuclease ABC subunit UvrB [Sphingobacteriia bacterium]
MEFSLQSEYLPAGDQPEAIKQLTEGILAGDQHQTLLGVTGSGKTFTIANVIQASARPTLVMSHNKTLAAQLYGELKHFFPENKVEFFISYYDYYQPEAYISSTNTYIEKDLSINQEIEKLRLKATAALLSGRRDIIVVASVSCIYGIGKPEDYAARIFHTFEGMIIGRNTFLYQLVELFYSRTEAKFERGNFRVKGDTVEIYPASEDHGVRYIFFGDELESIQVFEIDSGKKIDRCKEFTLYPANLFITSRQVLNNSLVNIQDEMMRQVVYFSEQGMGLEAKRIQERTEFDMEMMRELGYCSGIENYSRWLTERTPGSRPYCLIDYFPDDFLLVVDESHVTLPQIRGMFGGDRSRKLSLIENGFRLPSALDNRPLKFDEFEGLINQVIYVSATPEEYELEKSEGIIVEQVVRPTGLLDPEVQIRPCYNQIDDLLEEIDFCIKRDQRILVTTLTKRMAEELAGYLADLKIKARYIHSDVDALERVEILRDLRLGKFDVLIGINLLREGLDLPEVALVAILDADKEGFLRSARSLIQTAGRAARNSEGRVLLYADKITKSMQELIHETERRRAKQIRYNEAHGITPTTVSKTRENILNRTQIKINEGPVYYADSEDLPLVADPVLQYMNLDQLKKAGQEAKRKMEKAAREMDFPAAAKFRDEMFAIETQIEKHSNSQTTQG